MKRLECPCPPSAFRSDRRFSREMVYRIMPIEYGDVSRMALLQLIEVHRRAPTERTLEVCKLDDCKSRACGPDARTRSRILLPIDYASGLQTAVGRRGRKIMYAYACHCNCANGRNRRGGVKKGFADC